jgi:monoamine oxidase
MPPAAPINADEPWNSPNAQRLDAMPLASWIRGLKVSDLARKAITVELSADNGNSAARQSFLGNLTQVKGGGLEKFWTESEVYRCRGGNARLARKLAAAIGERRLRLGVPVREIRTDGANTLVRDAAGRRMKPITSCSRCLRPRGTTSGFRPGCHAPSGRRWASP